jgi:hypothetical protein
MIAAAFFLALASPGCATFVHDPSPPTNLRATPGGAIATTLSDGIEISVDEDRGGWLHVTSPAAGWVHVSMTTVRCGSNARAALRTLGERAKSDRVAADLLVRYALVADGAAGESAYGAFYDLMSTNPRLLIRVLDQFDDAQRRTLLRTAIGLNAGDPDAIRNFDHEITREPGHPTSKTWHALPAAYTSYPP